MKKKEPIYIPKKIILSVIAGHLFLAVIILSNRSTPKKNVSYGDIQTQYVSVKPTPKPTVHKKSVTKASQKKAAPVPKKTTAVAKKTPAPRKKATVTCAKLKKTPSIEKVKETKPVQPTLVHTEKPSNQSVQLEKPQTLSSKQGGGGKAKPSYAQLLQQVVKSQVKLRSEGKVVLKLRLNNQGELIKCNVVESTDPELIQPLIQQIQQLIFPSFMHERKKDKEYEFTLELT